MKKILAITLGLSLSFMSIFANAFQFKQVNPSPGTVLFQSTDLVNASTGLAGVNHISFVKNKVAIHNPSKSKVFEVDPSMGTIVTRYTFNNGRGFDVDN